MSARSPSSNNVVLVTGSNGGTGRRVVRELLNDGSYVVRCLTRSRERLDAALKKVGVDLDSEERDGRLQVFVSDLFNVRDEMFENLYAVISCTGVKVGPVDDPDRTKYFQGVKFYEPRILEDSPENVEYIGLTNLVDGVRKWYKELNAAQIEVLKMEDAEDVKNVWGVLDDVVMGGVSSSYVDVKDDSLVFGGEVKTENSGGFCSIRTADFEQPLDLSGFEGLRMRVKGDGKRYKLIVRCEKRWDGRAHCYSFSTKKGEWMDVEVPFSAFNTVFRAKTVPDGPKLDPKNVLAFQLMLSKFEYDGDLNPEFEAGVFELKVESLAAYKKHEGDVVPRLVIVGSAGVTRVLRKDEFDLEKQPPAVRMNDMLGRILEWKLAGEDVVRQSGIPYTIVRPCALTEKEPLGIEQLKFDQGDTMTGQVSREDIAPLLVSALKNVDMVNKTVEVAGVKEGEIVEGSVEDRVKGLKEDAEDKERQFAAFPYVPSNVAKS